MTLDSTCQWRQGDPNVLGFSQQGNAKSSDLLLDLIVRNTGTVGTALTGIEAEIFDWRPKLHGLPGEGLLFSQITYVVSVTVENRVYIRRYANHQCSSKPGIRSVSKSGLQTRATRGMGPYVFRCWPAQERSSDCQRCTRLCELN